MVFGSRQNDYPLTHAFDTVTGLSSGIRFIDRQDSLTNNVLAYGRYKLKMDGYDTSFVYVNYQDCDYSNGEGSGGFGTNYLTADIELNFDKSTGRFEAKHYGGNYSYTPNGSEIGVWDHGWKYIPLDSTSTRTDCFMVPLTIENEFSQPTGGTVSDENLVVDNICDNPVASGTTIANWGLGTSHSVRSEFSKYQNIDSTNSHYRHHNWNEASSNPAFNYLRIVDTATLFATYRSKFKTVLAGQVLLQAEGIAQLGAIKIRDPWRIKSGNDSCTLENDGTFQSYEIDSGNGLNLGDFDGFGGVHKNQYATTSSLPYYSIQSSLFKTLQNGVWIDTVAFRPSPGHAVLIDYKTSDVSKAEVVTDPNTSHDSTGYLTKAVVFKEDSSTIFARYKLHRTSNAPYYTSISRSPVSPNSQRKIDVVLSQGGATYPDGLYQCVYESMGDVWFIQSTDQGVSWSPEILVSSGNASAKHPCISSDASGAYITYIEHQTGGSWNVFLKNYSSGQITDVDTPPSDNQTYSDDAPVVQSDGASNTLLLIWEGDSTQTQLRYSAYYYSIEFDHGAIQNTGMAAKAMRPTITHDSTEYCFAWREQYEIHESEAEFFTTNGSPTAYFFADIVISDPGKIAIGAPSITLDYHFNPSVAWTTWDNTYPFLNVISFRQRVYGNWGTIATFTSGASDDYWAPSVGAFASVYQSDGIRIAHNRDYGTAPITVQQLVNGNWSVPACDIAYEGLHPSVIARADSTKLRAVFPQPSTVVSGLMEISFDENCLSKASSTLKSAREIIVLQDTSRISVRLCEIKLKVGSDETDLDWNTGYDTLVVGKTKQVHDYMRTAPFSVPSGSRLLYRLTDEKKGLHHFADSMRLYVQVVDANTNAIVSTLSQFHPRTQSQGHRNNNNSISLSGIAGRNVYLRLVLEHQDPDIRLLAVDTYLAPGGSFPKEEEGITETTIATSGYALDQNYPNPFNPETRISYSIPAVASVKITVLDVLGRAIKELVNEEKSAGSHSVLFNGQALPSGIYYYRMIANGTTVMRKMALVK